MSRYGWTGRIRHGLYRCKCGHWNYYRTATERIDKRCNAQGCDYRARVVLDRTPRRGGRLRTADVREYPPHRPPITIKSEQKARNRHARQAREQRERMDMRIDRGVFHTAAEIQDAQDAVDRERHGGTFRLIDRRDLKRHPFLGDSRLELNRERANSSENDAQDPPSKDRSTDDSTDAEELD